MAYTLNTIKEKYIYNCYQLKEKYFYSIIK